MERTGRPRDPLIDDAVRTATADVLSQVGYARLTLEEVARRAGTTKPAIYRRWRSRQHLVLDVLGRRLGASVTRVPDSGCVVCDLIEGISLFATAFRRVPPGELAALLADCAGQPGLRTTVMRTLFEPARHAVGELVDRAKARGDLRADLDRDLAVDVLGALVHYRALFAHASTDTDSAAITATTLLRGMATRKVDHAH